MEAEAAAATLVCALVLLLQNLPTRRSITQLQAQPYLIYHNYTLYTLDSFYGLGGMIPPQTGA
jgi:hypothetical protein